MKYPVFLTVTLAMAISCATTDHDPENAKQSFDYAAEPYHDENYEIAINRLGEFRSRFPYSQYAVQAELYIANAQFEQGRYAEAAEAYEQFIKLHPKHKEVAFAMFRVGDSFWQEAPETVDREQDFTEKAIANWRGLTRKFPDSEHATKAKALIIKGEERIAKSHEFIAKFYCKQEIWHACAHRSLRLIDEFPTKKEMVREALARAANAFEKMLEEKKSDDKDSNYFFKTYSTAQIREKAATLKKRAAALR